MWSRRSQTIDSWWRYLLASLLLVLSFRVFSTAVIGQYNGATLDYRQQYQQLVTHFQAQGQIIPTNIASKVLLETDGDVTASTNKLDKYVQILKALQTRHPQMSTLSLSLIAEKNTNSFVQADTAASNAENTADRLQDYYHLNTIAAQIIAAQNPNSFTDALTIANQVLNSATTMKKEAGISSNAAAQVLLALDLTGELGFAADDGKEVSSLINSMKNGSGLSGTTSNELLAALNVFTVDNFNSDASNVQQLANKLVNEKLSGDVKSFVDTGAAQDLAALNLGSLAGFSRSNSGFPSLQEANLGNLAGKAGQYKDTYDAVGADLGSDKLAGLGSENLKVLARENAALEAAKAKEVTKKQAEKEIDPSSASSSSPKTPETSTPAEETSPTDEELSEEDEEVAAAPDYIRSGAQGSLINAILDKISASGVAGDVLNGFKLKTIAKNLSLEGYEAYHVKRISHLWPYTRFSNRRNNVDFSEATIPLMRNSAYVPERLNSAETYYGYNARVGYNDGDILAESAWVAKMSQPVKCAMKAANLAYIVRTCDIAGAATCEGLYYTAEGKETIKGTKIKVHDLALAVTAILILDGSERDELINAVAIALAMGKGDISGVMNKVNTVIDKIGGENSEIFKRLEAMAADEIMEPIADNRIPFCETLYDTKSPSTNTETGLLTDIATGKIDPEEAGKIYLRWAIEKLDFYLAREYRTAYLVQVTRICPTTKQWFCPKSHVYKYPYFYSGSCYPHFQSPCNMDITPDQVRLYPFKVPDLFTNKNFCQTTELEYPGLLEDVKCEVTDKFHYVDMIQEYTDPAILNTNFLINVKNLEKQRQKIVEERKQKAKNSAAACTTNSVTTLGYEADLSCSAKHGLSGELIDCQNCQGNDVKAAVVKVINGAIDNDQLYNIENPNGNSQGTDDITDALKSSSIVTSAYNPLEPAVNDTISFNDFCLCRERAFEFIPYFAYASLDYFVLEPISDEVERIEAHVVSPFFRAEQYQQFIKNDHRQNRKIQVQGVKSRLSDVPIWLPAGGPISNVLIQQEALYTQDTSLYKGFKECRSVPAYFETRCQGDGDGKDDEPFDEAKSNCILSAEAGCVRGCGMGDVSELTYSEEDGKTIIDCECGYSGEEDTGPRSFHYECSNTPN